MPPPLPQRALGFLLRCWSRAQEQLADRFTLLALGLRLARARGNGGRTLLLIEPNICHAEVVAGVLLQLEQLGIRPLLIVRRWHRREAGPLLRPRRGSLHMLNAPQLQRLCERLPERAAGLPILFTSSHDYDSHRSIPDGWGAPLLRHPATWWIQHDRRELHANPALQELEGRNRLISLVPGRPYASGAVLTPLFPAPQQRSEPRAKAPRRFLVPGTMGRNLEAIFAAFRASGHNPAGFRLFITGWTEGTRIRALAARHGLEGSVQSLGRVPYLRLLELVKRCDLLIGPTDQAAYAGGRAVSGARQLSLSFATPLILDEDLAQEWDLMPGAITHRGNFEDGIISALSSEPAHLVRLRQVLRQKAAEAAAQSREQLRRMLSDRQSVLPAGP